MGVTAGDIPLVQAGLGGATGGKFPATTWGLLYRLLYDGQPVVDFLAPDPLTRPGQWVGPIPNELGGGGLIGGGGTTIGGGTGTNPGVTIGGGGNPGVTPGVTPGGNPGVTIGGGGGGTPTPGTSPPIQLGGGGPPPTLHP
jgi:hypothetical protein